MTGEFAHYAVSPETVWGHADGLSGVGGDVERLGGDVHGAHRRAQQGVAGLLEHPMVTAEQPVASKVSRWLASAVFSGGAIRRFGDAVHDYNSGIDDLNWRWREAVANRFGVAAPDTSGVTSTVEESRLLSDYHDQVANARQAYWLELEQERVNRLEAALDETARQVAGLLDAGPEDEQAVLTLFQAGALPMSAPLVFPGVRFDKVDAELLYANLLDSGRLPDVESMSDDTLDAWLRNHPVEAEQLAVVLVLPGPLTDGQERVARAIGRYDAWQVARGLEMPPGRPGLTQVADGTERLTGINDRFAEAGSLTEAEQAYLHAWYDGLGADHLAALPAYVDAAVRASHPGVDQNTLGAMLTNAQARYLSPVADGIMNLSHEAGSLQNMPQAIQDLAHTEIGARDAQEGSWPWPALDEHGNPLFRMTEPPDFTVAGLERYGDFVSLLETATVEGDVVFTRELGESALRVKQDLNAISANTTEALRWDSYGEDAHEALRLATFDDEVSRMLAVVARNEDAASAMLIDDGTRPLLLGLNWYDDHGVVEILQAGAGRDPDGAGEEQAKATLKLIQEVGGDRDFYLDRMTDDMRAAVVDVGIEWIDMIGRLAAEKSPSDYGTYVDIHGEKGIGFQLSAVDRSRFLEFIAGAGEEHALHFRGASVDYSRELVAEALQTGEPDKVKLALAMAGQLDGAITRADFSYFGDQMGAEFDEALAAHQAEVRRSNGFRLVAEIGWQASSLALGSATGGQSMWLTTLATPLVEEMIGVILDAGHPPEYRTAGTLQELFDADRLNQSPERQYFLLSAFEQAGISAADSCPELYRSDGTLRPLDELITDSQSSNYLQDLYRAESNVLEQWGNQHPGSGNFDVDVYGRARDSIHYQAEYRRYEPTGDWTDDVTARQRLYGERYVGDGEIRGWVGDVSELRVTTDPNTYYQSEYDRF